MIRAIESLLSFRAIVLRRSRSVFIAGKTMSGYRKVNYYELCRLCTSSEGNKMNIFRDEGRRRQLQTKIQAYLPIQVSVFRLALRRQTTFNEPFPRLLLARQFRLPVRYFANNVKVCMYQRTKNMWRNIWQISVVWDVAENPLKTTRLMQLIFCRIIFIFQNRIGFCLE